MNDFASATETAKNEGSQAIAFSLLIAAHSLEDRIEKSLEEHGLSLAKLNVLSRLAEAGEPLTLSEIATRLQCVRSNVTQLVDRLEGDGLVRREADSGDRRSIRAVLTADGRRSQEAGATELAAVTTQFAGSLPDQERAALERLLEMLR